jgi:hypothetical protein
VRAARSSQRRSACTSWTTQEIARACVGVPDIEFRAALFAFAGDRGSYWELQRALFQDALDLRERHE